MNSLLVKAQSPRTSAASAYMEHIQSKQQMGTVAAKTAPKKDPRQTIAPLPPPVATASHPQRSIRLRRTAPSSSSPLPPSPTVHANSVDTSTIGSATGGTDKAMRPRKAKSPRQTAQSSSTTSTQSSKSPRSRSSSGRSKKPPLSSCHKYYSRSVMSEATNSTYLSSDSEEDRTVHSDSISAHSGSQRSGGTGSSLHSTGSKSSSRLSSDRNPDKANDTSGTALVPYNPPSSPSPPPLSTDNEDPNDTASDSAAVNRKTTSSSSSRYYERPSQQRRPTIPSNTDDLAEMESNVFSYSDEDDFHQLRANDLLYQQQQQQYFRQRHFMSDDSSVGCDYSDDDVDDDIDDEDVHEEVETLVDLDTLIQETSTRWKLSVNETVKNTVTATTMQKQGRSSNAAAAATFSFGDEDFRLSSSSSNSSNKTTEQNSPGNTAMGMSSLAATTGMPATASRLIQDQQAQIEALRAALSRQETHTTHQQQQPLTGQAQQPQHQHANGGVHPIQVLTVSADHNLECTDDLTVWSGFHSASAPPPRRPDAASVAECNPRGAVASAVAPMSSRPVTRQLQLSSAKTGMTRTAIFTGTLEAGTGDRPHEADLITGSGVLQFLETGDVYRGELVESEMHGYGSYTFSTKSASNMTFDNSGGPKMLRGRFEHNVFVG